MPACLPAIARCSPPVSPQLFTPEDLKAAQQQSGAAEVRSAAREFKLRENYSQRASQGLVTLPNFARDFTEFALSALIERVSDSFDLYLTTFFICHVLLEPKLGGSAVSGEKVTTIFRLLPISLPHYLT